MSKANINNTRKIGQNNTKSRVRAGMTNVIGTKTRRHGGTYGNTTTSKSGTLEAEGIITLDNGKQVLPHFYICSI
jgi:hypothetical protein